jgi:hypothetical protein
MTTISSYKQVLNLDSDGVKIQQIQMLTESCQCYHDILKQYTVNPVLCLMSPLGHENVAL